MPSQLTLLSSNRFRTTSAASQPLSCVNPNCSVVDDHDGIELSRAFPVALLGSGSAFTGTSQDGVEVVPDLPLVAVRDPAPGVAIQAHEVRQYVLGRDQYFSSGDIGITVRPVDRLRPPSG